jgi:hypothetical protein
MCVLSRVYHYEHELTAELLKCSISLAYVFHSALVLSTVACSCQSKSLFNFTSPH